MTNNQMWFKIAKFLEQFPNGATKWSQATDEVRDIARSCRIILQQEPCDFTKLNTPSLWNTIGKDYIIKSWKIMNNVQKMELFLEYKEWFIGVE